MVTLRKRPRTQETPVNPKQTNNSSNEVSGYELCREKRIKENLERMQKLGIFDLSNKLKSGVLLPNKRSPRKVFDGKSYSPLQSSLPPRRSSRLQNATPVSYTEVREKRTKKEDDLLGPLVGEGLRPEIYTEEHEKLLGTCGLTWDLFVDGYTKDGVRIYDPINGKTCHQCRQKTLGHRTHCIECNLVTGQFCGDCLYLRYGEHVLEATQNPNWICPVCRGICNCSLCRKAKGWPATGAISRRIAKLGFKSVAHYLIQTRRAETNSDEIGTDDPVSTKRSLSFTNTEEVCEHNDSITSEDWQHENSKHGFINNRGNELQEKKKESLNLDNMHGISNVQGEEMKVMTKETMSDNVVSREKDEESEDHFASKRGKHSFVDKRGYESGVVKSELLNSKGEKEGLMCEHGVKNVKDDGLKGEKEGLMCEHGVKNVKDKHSKGEKEGSTSEHGATVIDVATTSEAKPDSIAGRLRQRRNRS
ncbi:hypothetical protein IFM89_010063 [Coptis chinensis]|uniref:Zinc-finger domain-containing protein n=1 Tax=Coptis chinensis TaxID=261450 RepID=A0A835LPZ5_9MAGN|nr:hypothetical protein IFM89_010063 [Coptis chinensis]